MYIMAAILKKMVAIKVKDQIWNGPVAKFTVMVCSPSMQNVMFLSLNEKKFTSQPNYMYLLSDV